MSGKGDRNRPINIPRDEWDKKYEEIFGNKKDETFQEKKTPKKRKCKSTKS